MAIETVTEDAEWPFDPATYQLRLEKGEADGYAELDATGNVPLSQLANVANPQTPVTKRVSLAIGSDGNASATASAHDYNQRTLIQLPVTTTRWRVRFRNASALTGTATAGSWDGVGVWVGTPLFAAAGLPWGRTFATAPTQALGAFTTPSDGTDFVSDWVTNTGLQFQAGVPAGLSTGITHATSTVYTSSAQGWTYSGSGAAAAGGNAAPLAVTPSNLVVGDWRLEYEFATVAVGGIPVGVCIGDSITAGWDSGPSTPGASPPVMQGFDPHQTWPGAASLRNGFAVVNMGVGSTRAAQWQTGTGWRWDRFDLATTVPEFAVISLGTNDIFDGTAVATMQGYIQTIITKLAALGVHEVWLGTQIPRSYTGATETLRTGLNAWIRNGPCGSFGAFDFDKAMNLQATPNVMDPDLFGSYPHPNRAGYQKMASVVQRIR